MTGNLHRRGSRRWLFFILVVAFSLASMLRFHTYSLESSDYDDTESSLMNNEDSFSCTKWAVVTIASITTTKSTLETMQRIARHVDWCVVIVTKQKPKSTKDADGIHWFTESEHIECQQEETAMGDLCRLLSSASRNLGYLYAMSKGAKLILDLDESISFSESMAPLQVLQEDSQTPILDSGIRVPLVGPTLFNPYPLMTASNEDAVPRGFPNEKNTRYTQGQMAFVDTGPDRNGPWHLKHRTQVDLSIISFTVDDTTTTFDSDSPLLAPLHTYTPYSSDMTLYLQDALWSLLLPSSIVDNDIWRSYMAQTLTRDSKLRLGFASGEGAKTTRTNSQSTVDIHVPQLLNFLQGWNSNKSSLPDRMLQLWSDLHAAGYLPEAQDVKICQLWIQFLKEINYSFPRVLSRHRYHKVVVMGQFNYGDISARHVMLWAQKWREHFPHVIVRGPFDRKMIAQLNAHGIPAFSSSPDEGFYSPLENLMKTLQDYQDDPSIEGVMYVHDDMLLNLTAIDHGTGVFPTQNVLTSFLWDRRNSEHLFPDPRKVPELAAPYAYKIYKNGTLANLHGQTFTTIQGLAATLNNWKWRERNCLPGQLRMAQDSRSDPYRDDDGGLFFPPFSQFDFLYVPTRLTNEFVDIAKLHLEKPPVFLECSCAMVVEVLRRFHNATVQWANLCSTFDKSRNRPEMIQECLQNTTSFGFFHPFKLSHGLASWSAMFDAVIE